MISRCGVTVSLIFALVILLWEKAGALTNSTLGSYWHIFNDSMLERYIEEAKGDSKKLAPLTKLYLKEALERIERNQFPHDCSGKKFLISRGMRTGFGSEIHMEGLGLAMALETGRIFMPPFRAGFEDKWKCYYKTYTNCTINDAKWKEQMAYNLKHYPISRGHIRMFKVPEKEKLRAVQTKVIDKTVIHRATKEYENEEYLTIMESVHIGPYFKIVPTIVQDLVDKLPIANRLKHYWWRAVAAGFLLREQQHTTATVSKLRMSGIDDLKGQCVASYIRHGDKAREMQLIPFAEYAKAAERAWDMWSERGGVTPGARRTLVMGTETPNVWKEAQEWAKVSGWDVKFNPIQKELWAAKGWDSEGAHVIDTEMKNRPRLDKLAGEGALSKVDPNQELCYSQSHMYVPTFPTKASDQIKTPNVVVTKTSPIALRFEYLSMLVNMRDFLSCNIHVCTLASNYCRIIDVMRAVLGKPGTLWVDLSRETCKNPPCFYGDEAQLSSMSY